MPSVLPGHKAPQSDSINVQVLIRWRGYSSLKQLDLFITFNTSSKILHETWQFSEWWHWVLQRPFQYIAFFCVRNYVLCSFAFSIYTKEANLCCFSLSLQNKLKEPCGNEERQFFLREVQPCKLNSDLCCLNLKSVHCPYAFNECTDVRSCWTMCFLLRIPGTLTGLFAWLNGAHDNPDVKAHELVVWAQFKQIVHGVIRHQLWWKI